MGRLENRERNAMARMFNTEDEKALENYETYIKYLSDRALVAFHKDELIEMLGLRRRAREIFSEPKLSAFKRYGITVRVPDKYWGNGGGQNKTVLTEYGYQLMREVLREEWLSQ